MSYEPKSTDCFNVLNYYLEKYGPEDLKYDWTEFLADIETYKSIVFVLASTLLPNVLSDIQVSFDSKAFLHVLIVHPQRIALIV